MLGIGVGRLWVEAVGVAANCRGNVALRLREFDFFEALVDGIVRLFCL